MGKIEIKVNTTGYSGRKLSKPVTVFTNDPDPARKQISLTIQGNVKQFVSISPNRVRMTGQAGNEIRSKVSIVPQPEYPFKILEVKTERPDNIRVEMETVQKSNGTEYLLTVVNLKQAKTRYSDNIILKTDSPVKPELKISVYGTIFDPPQPTPDKTQIMPESGKTEVKPEPGKAGIMPESGKTETKPESGVN